MRDACLIFSAMKNDSSGFFLKEMELELQTLTGEHVTGLPATFYFNIILLCCV